MSTILYSIAIVLVEYSIDIPYMQVSPKSLDTRKLTRGGAH